jgi:hypothetical protein
MRNDIKCQVADYLMRPSRNSKCPCSSGKKFKNCCLALQQKRSAEPLEESLRKKINRFFSSERFVPDYQDAVSKYTDNPDELKDTAARLNFNDWFIHDYNLKEGTTIIKLFTQELNENLDELEKETVTLWSDSPIRLYEIIDVKKGTGFLAKDVFDHTQRFVHDVSASKKVVLYDLVFARLYLIGTIARMAGSAYLMPHRVLKDARQFILHDHERAKCSSLDDYFKANSLSVIRYLNLLANSEKPHLTPEGDAITVSRAEYSINSMRKAKRLLDDSFDMIYAGRLGKKYRYDIVEEDTLRESDTVDGISYQSYYVSARKGQPNLRVIANIGFDTKSLYIECMSENRLDRSKKIVNELLGSLARHEKDTQGVTEQNDGDKNTSVINEKKVAKITARFFEEYYRVWLDTKMPALGGRTPLEATKTANGRERLKEMIKDIENTELHNGQNLYVKKLKSELCL